VSFPDGTTVPALGIGTYRMGEDRAAREREVAALALALDLGLSVIDTAEMYANGGAESVVGQALQGRRRERAFIVSKVLPSHASRRGVIGACERSLARMAIERIDLYLLHWRSASPLTETIEGFDRLLAEGKIARWGVSNFDLADMQELSALHGGGRCAADQVYYSVSRRGIEFELLPRLASRSIPAMAYCPFDEGRLLQDAILGRVARKHDVGVAQVALAWLLVRPGVIVIPKAASAGHVRQNAAAVKLTLDAEDLSLIDRQFPPPSRRQPLTVV